MDKTLHYLFTSQTRVKILQLFFTHVNDSFHVREVVRRVDEEINSVRRELARLKKIGLLRSERRQNRLFYYLKSDFSLFPELLRLVAKSTGLGRQLLEQAKSLGRINFATIALRYLLGGLASSTQVDLLLVGKVNSEVLKKLIQAVQEKNGREINYTVMTYEEFNFRKKRRDHFIQEVLLQPHLVLWGDEMELMKM